MRRIILSGIALLVGLVPPAVAAQSSPAAGAGTVALSLERALELARAGNPRLAAARTAVILPEAALAQATRLSNPTLALTVAPGLNAGTGVALSVGKRFEVAGQRGLRANASRAGVEASRWDVANEWRTLRTEVAQAFFSLRVAQDKVEVLDSVQAVTSRLRDAARLKLEGGFAPELDYNLARAQLLLAQLQRRQATSELTARKAELNALLGRAPGRDVVATGPLLAGPAPAGITAETLVAKARQNRPDARAVAERARAASSRADLARRLAVPDLSLAVGLQNDADGLRTIGLGLGVSVPVFDRNGYGRDVARAEQLRVSAETETTSLAIAREVVAATAQLESASAALAAYRGELLVLADSSQRFAADAYARGELDITTALLAQRQGTEARIGYLAAVLDFDRAKLELEGAVGSGLETPKVGTDKEDIR